MYCHISYHHTIPGEVRPSGLGGEVRHKKTKLVVLIMKAVTSTRFLFEDIITH